MLSACFSQPLPHFKRFLLRLTGNCFPKQVPLPPAAHPAEGPWLWQWASLPWATSGRGTARRAGPGPAEDTRGLLRPGANGNGPKSFRGTPVYSRVRSQLQARLKMPCSSDTPNSCPHVACAVPPQQRILSTLSSLQFPSALTTAAMRQIALFFNDTETFEHCISRIPSRER
ncbi:unnamed protein product [Rangifer tarandus platyrhynchus]|uniref:Uncharacterized protein n=1 Tax=Rangifer tarandus platyrhynchus TaxID=3082113 RepID=A0AC59ZHU7_RANTA